MIKRQVLNGLLGVNADDSYKAHQSGDAVSMVNTRIIDYVDGDSGDVQNVLGNALLTNSALLSGASTCIGAIANERNSKIYFFVFNHDDSTKHAIYQYDQSGGFTKMVSNNQFSGVGNTLGFGYFRITAASIVNDFLVYSVNEGEVRAIDLTYWRNNSPTNVPPSKIYLSVLPPVYPMSVTIIDSGALNTVVARQFLRFYYRYIYTDGRISALSPASVLKSIHDTDDNNINRIDLAIPIQQKVHDGVQSLQVIGYNDESSTYFVVSDIRSASVFSAHNAGTTQIVVQYTATNTYESVADVDTGYIHATPPIDVKAISAAKSRLFFGNYKNWLSDDAVSNVGYGAIPTISYQTLVTTTPSCFMEGSVFDVAVVYRDSAGRTSGVKKLNISATIPYRDGSGTDVQSIFTNIRPYLPHEDRTTVPDSITFNLATAAADTIPSWAETAEVLISDNKAFTDFIQFPLRSIYADSLNSDGTKNDYKYQFGLEFAVKLNDGTFAFANSQRFLSETHNTDEIGYFALNLRDAIEFGLGWDFIPGDYIRVTFYRTSEVRSSAGTWHEELVTGEIIAQQDQRLVIRIHDLPQLGGLPDYLGYTTELSNLLYVDSTGYSDNNYYCDFGVATIFRRATIDTSQYRETGLVFDVNSLPTSCKIKGDTSVTKKIHKSVPASFDPTPVEKTILCVNSHGEHLFGVRTYRSFFGRSVGYIDLTQQLSSEQRTTALVFSGVYTQGTRNNNLNYVESLNETILPSEMVAINKLQLASKTESIGTVMLAIGEVSTASIYIGESQLVGSSSNADLIIDSSVVGSVNILQGGYGTKHPESVVERNGNVYWYDANKADVIRYGRNGVIPVSSNKYKSVINKITTGASSDVSIVGHFDPIQDEYLLSVSDPHRSETFNLADYGSSTLINASYTTLSGSLSIPLTGLSLDDVVEIKIDTLVNKDFNGLRLFFGGLPIYSTTSHKLDRSKSIYVRFVPTAQSGNVSFVGLPFDPFLPQDVTIRIAKYGHDYSKTHHHMPCTHAFNESVNKWRGYDTYFAEASAIIENKMFVFYNANMYAAHAQNSPTFYGQTHPCAISHYLTYSNVVSIPVSHHLESSVAPAKSRLQSETHATEAVSADYVEQEEIFKLSFRRDKLSGSLLTGKRVRGSKLLSLLRMPSVFSLKRIYTEIKDSTGH
jgi:hypothetical protein